MAKVYPGEIRKGKAKSKETETHLADTAREMIDGFTKKKK
jgi:hypothetical protein